MSKENWQSIQNFVKNNAFEYRINCRYAKLCFLSCAVRHRNLTKFHAEFAVFFLRRNCSPCTYLTAHCICTWLGWWHCRLSTVWTTSHVLFWYHLHRSSVSSQRLHLTACQQTLGTCGVCTSPMTMSHSAPQHRPSSSTTPDAHSVLGLRVPRRLLCQFFFLFFVFNWSALFLRMVPCIKC